MSTHDVDGRPYAKLSQLKAGDVVIPDDGFDNLTVDKEYTVYAYAMGPYVLDDHHLAFYLEGQADDGEHCVGIYLKGGDAS